MAMGRDGYGGREEKILKTQGVRELRGTWKDHTYGSWSDQERSRSEWTGRLGTRTKVTNE